VYFRGSVHHVRAHFGEVYKLILEKAKADKIVTTDDSNHWKDTAESKRKERGPILQQMKVTIDANTEHIDGLDLNVESLCKQIGSLSEYVHQVNPKSVDARKRKLPLGHRIAAATAFIKAVITAVSLGVDGGSRPSLIRALEKILTDIIDFGDLPHIRRVIEMRLSKPASDELGSAYSEIKETFELGVKLVEGEGEEALKSGLEGGNAAVALGAIATLACGDCSGAQKKDDVDESNSKGGEQQKEKTDEVSDSINSSEESHVESIENIANITASKNDKAGDTATQPTTERTKCNTTIPESFRDADLSLEDEKKLPFHAAVKFKDLESLKETIQKTDANDLSSSINAVDSEGRTALDLAARTGQCHMVNFLESQGGDSNVRSIVGMKFIGRVRNRKHQEYDKYLLSLA